MYYLWNSKFIPVDISVPNLAKLSDSTLLLTGRTLETSMSKQLISSTAIISIEPYEIEIQYDISGNSSVTVVPKLDISTTPGFQISDSIKISHPTVLIYGSNKALDTLKSIYTKLVTLENVSNTRELTAHLDLPAGIRSEVETVKLTIPIDEFTEKKLQLSVLCQDIPSNYVLRIFPSNVDIICYIPISRFRELSEQDFEIEIPFNEFEENQVSGRIPVRLTKKPLWVTSPVTKPNELEFIIEQIKHD